MTFIKRAAQGEIQITRLPDGFTIPKSAKPLKKEACKLIIGHSETGHHHVLERPAAVHIAADTPDGMRILYAILAEPNALIHERGFDTHAPQPLQPGAYEFRIGREFDPYKEIARRQAD